MTDRTMRASVGLAIVGLYIIVTIMVLIWNFFLIDDGDIGLFFDSMSKANFLLGPVGFVMGYYFRGEKTT